MYSKDTIVFLLVLIKILERINAGNVVEREKLIKTVKSFIKKVQICLSTNRDPSIDPELKNDYEEVINQLAEFKF